MLLHIPDRIKLVVNLVTNHFVLVEAPIGIDAARIFKSLLGFLVDQANLRTDGVPNSITCLVLVNDLNTPKILGRHADVIVDVTGHLLVVWAKRS